MTIEQNVTALKNLISDCEQRYHRVSGSVELIAASKSQSIEKIISAYNAGIRHFGENYLQEALQKISQLTDKAIVWHFIGPIQSNKTKKIAEHFGWVHSVDSQRIAQRLNDQRPAHLPPLNICIEVNVSHESSKSGITENEVISLAQFCLTQPHLKLRGLMTIPATETDFLKQRSQFHKLFLLAEKLRQQNINVDTLSMGMSGDFAAAIAEGATFVRIGTALFGQR